MSKILILAETQKGQLKRSTAELCCWARRSGATIGSVVLGSSAAAVVGELEALGVSQIYSAPDANLDRYNPEIFAQLVTDAIKQMGASIVLGSASSIGRDLFPRLAARHDGGLLSDCIDLKLEGTRLTARKPLYAGKCFAQMGFSDSAIQFILMRPNQLMVDSGSGAKAEIKTLSPVQPLWATVKEVVSGASQKLDLTEANVIVSGGRGLKEAGNFKLLEELGDTLGATVGASRAVVDAGWVSHGMQVGQTGKTVAPSLYIAVGISGAVQHLAGMSGSKVIVAINNDANAPIFQKATYGIVGDLFEVVPKLTAEFRKVLQK